MVDVSLQQASSYPYMSLERLTSGTLSYQTDVFSLACTAYTFLAGEPPFVDAPIEDQVQMRVDELPNISMLVPALSSTTDEVLKKALHPHKGKRYLSATEFISALKNSLEETPVAEVDEKTLVFFSYSHLDIEFAKQLVHSLKEEKSIEVWFDEYTLVAGENWHNRIEQGIKNADKFVVLVTPNSATSDFVQAEINYAFNEGKCIIPVIHEKPEVPMRLRTLHYFELDKEGYYRSVELLKRLILTKDKK